jgi:hypothetical protein
LVRFYAFGYQGHGIIFAKTGLFSGDNSLVAIGVFGEVIVD